MAFFNLHVNLLAAVIFAGSRDVVLQPRTHPHGIMSCNSCPQHRSPLVVSRAAVLDLCGGPYACYVSSVPLHKFGNKLGRASRWNCGAFERTTERAFFIL